MLPHLLQIIFLLSAVCAASVLGSVTTSPGIRIPVTRVFKGTNTTQVLAGDVGVSNAQDYAYVVHIGIGGQSLPVLLDTGSADLWVATDDCTSPECQGLAKYNKSSSTTLQQSTTPFKLGYLVGSVTGTLATETVTVGQYQIHDQVIALANHSDGLNLSSMAASGILGLSFGLASSIPQETGHTILDNLLLQFPEPSRRYFAFKLGRQNSRFQTDPTSSFTIGELDPDFAKDLNGFTFWDVVPSATMTKTYDYWKLPLVGLTINSTQAFQLSASKVAGSPTPIAVLDTGTTLVLGPRKDVEAFWNAVGSARLDPLSGMWQVRCDRAGMVEFVLGNKGKEKAIPINPVDVSWLIGASLDGWCQGGIQPNDDVHSGDWLLGDVFLRNVYAVHQLGIDGGAPRIGLMSTTVMDDALTSFRTARGPDKGPPPTLRPVGSAISERGGISEPAVYSISGISGFFIGALLVIGFRIRRDRKA